MEELEHLHREQTRDMQAAQQKVGWNEALELAARYMLSRQVMASEFYADEIRKLKVEES